MSAIPYGLKAEISREQAAWMFIGATFQRGSEHCEDCGWCEHKGQMVGFDEGRAHDVWTECTLRRPYSPEECPAYREHLAHVAEEQAEALEAKQ